MVRQEEFPFTAEQIGSEVLERFSGDIYGPKEIIRELVKNAYDSYFELEKHLEERKLDIEPFERAVRISVVDEDVIIADGGLGLDKEALSKLVSIALTDKRDVEGVSGFRGIGFWSAYTGGDRIVVESTKHGSDRRYRLHLNTKRMRSLQGPRTSIGKIMNDPKCMRLESEPAPKEEHQTTIIISAQSDEARLRPMILNEVLMRDALLAGCSCELADASLSGDFLKRFCERNNIKSAKLFFQGIPINKIIPSGVQDFQTKTFEFTIGNKKEVLAHVWYATNSENGRLDTTPGIQIVRDSFPIGPTNLYADRTIIGSKIEITRRDLIDWHIGEVHLVHDLLRPDAAGEAIRDSILQNEFREQLRQFYASLIETSYAMQRRATLKADYAKMARQLEAITARKEELQTISDADRSEIKRIAQTIERDKAAKKSRGEQGVGSREVLLRDDVVKARQRQITKLLKDLDADSLLSEQNGAAARPPKRAAKKAPTDNKTSGSVNGSTGTQMSETVSRDAVLAMLDQVRDAVMETLKDDFLLQQDLIAKINEIAKKL
jgi:hypothetical protein